MAYRTRLIGTHQQGAWQDALTGVPHSYWHTWPACHGASLSTGTPVWLYVGEDTASGARAVLPFGERVYAGATDVFTPLGYSGFAVGGSSTQHRDAWLDFARERNYVAGYFALHPRTAAQDLHESLVRTNDLFFTASVGDERALLSRVNRNVRRAVAAWEKRGRSYVEDRAQLTAFAVGHYADFMGDVGANPLSMWSKEHLRLMLNDPAVLVAGVDDDEGICALYSFATTPYGAECHLNLSVRDGREFTTALGWWGLKATAARGVPWLNWGGGVRTGDAVSRAKLKFRPVLEPLLTAREVYRDDAYSELAGVAGHDPTDRDGYFPRYWQGARSWGRPSVA